LYAVLPSFVDELRDVMAPCERSVTVVLVAACEGAIATTDRPVTNAADAKAATARNARVFLILISPCLGRHRLVTPFISTGLLPSGKLVVSQIKP
jgi:hypothetical protein